MCFPALLAAPLIAAEAATVVGATAATAATATAATAGGMFGGMSGFQMLSTGISMASKLAESSAQQDQANYEAAVARNNQQIATNNAADATRRAELEAQRVSRNAASTVGSQRAAFAAKGLDISDGTPGDIIDQTNFFGKVDTETARYNGKVEAWNKLSQASNYGAQAKASSAKADGLGTSGLLSGAGAVSDKWYQYSVKK
jgi:hypothetical protein